MDIKKVLMFLVLGMFLISCVSAADWDNVADYKNEDKTVEITNWLGLGEKLGEATLTSHKDVNEVRRVGAGKDIVVMYYDFNFAEGYRGGLGDVKFYDINNGKKEIEKDYHFVQEIKIPYNVSRMKEGKCKLLVNGSSQCDSVFSHYETMYRSEWVKLDVNDIPSGEVRIGLATDVNEGDYLDGVWKIAGKYVTKHAEWTSGLGVDLYAYYKFEDNNESINGIYNLSAYEGAPTFTAGLINNAGSLSDANNFKIEDDDSVLLLNDESAMGFWVKPSSLASGGGFIRKSAITGDVGWGMHQLSSGGIRLGLQWGNTDFSNVLYPDKWTFILINVNASSGANTCLYVNASLQGCVNTVSDTSTDDVEIGDGHAWSGNDYNGLWDEMGVWNRSLSQSEITQLWNDHSGIAYTKAPYLITITPNLDNPANDTKTTSTDLNFNSTISVTNANVTNATLYLWNTDGTENYTDTNIDADGGNFSTTWDVINLADDTYLWNVLGCADNSTTGACAWNSTNYTFAIDRSDPILSYPTNLTNLTTYSFNISSNFNISVTDDNLDSCWYSSSDNPVNQTGNCNDYSPINWSIQGKKNVTTCANDSLGNEDCRSDKIIVALISYAQKENYDPVGEGTNITYNLELNFTGTDMPSSSAYLVLNGSSYNPQTTAGTNTYNFYHSLIIPEGWGNTTGNLIDWYWDYTIEDYETNKSTSTTNTTIYSVALDDCSSYNEVILNLSLKDEEDNEYINLSDEDTIIEVEALLGKAGTEWKFSQKWTNENNVTICVPAGLLNNSNYSIDFTIGFSADDHVNEFFYLDNGTLSQDEKINSLTNKTINLMDLLTADSTSFLFNYFDEDGLVVDDIIIHTFRKYIGEGIFREIERSKQNDDGETVVHLVEEDVIYYFKISQGGSVLFTSNTYTALCQTTPCEIQLEESGGFQEFDDDWDLIDSGGYSISSSSLTREINMTYSLTSPSTMNLSVYSFEDDGDYNEIGSAQSTSTSDSLIVNVPTVSGNTTFFVSVYQDGDFKKSQWIDFEEDAGVYFGNTLSLFLGGLVILSLGLMTASQGGGVIIFLLLGMFISGVLGLVDYRTSAGANLLIYFVVAGVIILWKITRRTR